MAALLISLWTLHWSSHHYMLYPDKELHHYDDIYISPALFTGKPQHGVAMEFLAALGCNKNVESVAGSQLQSQQTFCS